MMVVVAKAVWLAGLVAWNIIRIPYARRARRIAVVRRGGRAREWALLGFAFLGLFAIPCVYVVAGWPRFADYPQAPAQVAVGTLTFVAALWLFHRAHKDLGRQWSVSLEIRERHQVVRTGVYRRIRHPMYASFWLWAIAQALLLPNVIAGSAGLICVGLLYLLRIGREEQLMIDTFGDEYRDYIAHTKRLIPGLY